MSMYGSVPAAGGAFLFNPRARSFLAALRSSVRESSDSHSLIAIASAIAKHKDVTPSEACNTL